LPVPLNPRPSPITLLRGEFYASPVPLTVKLATLSTYIIAFFLFVGFLSEENAIRTLFGDTGGGRGVEKGRGKRG
jgi:hypothetical protein